MIPDDQVPQGVLVRGFHPGYERNGIYTLDEVFTQIGNSWAEFDGDFIKITSDRYQVFRESLVCVRCGITGMYFAKERSAKKVRKQLKGGKFETSFRGTGRTWHFNLYGLQNGKEVMLTKDHVLPKSKGGGNDLSNLCTMCMTCNTEKGNSTQMFLLFWKQPEIEKAEAAYAG
jgi:hypothetical protein